jgi:hypothetical protein
LDEEFSRLTAIIPGGFGGWFYDESGRPNVYLVDVQQRGAAVAALVPMFRNRVVSVGGRGRPDVSQIEILQGQYDFRTLLEWREAIHREVPNLPGIVVLDVQERINRVVVGVEDPATTAAVRTALMRLGIPDEAVVVELRPRESVLTTLRDQADAVSGGFMLTWGASSACSLGFNAWRQTAQGWIPAFLTASHCSLRRGELDHQQYYQVARNSTAAFIGTEIFDPPFYADNPNCAPGWRCRYSDALLARFEAFRWSYGRIARPVPGTITIDATNPAFNIRGEIGYPEWGETLDAIGYASGWRTGRVTETCVRSYPAIGLELLCQDITNIPGAPGDSGGPVFSRVDNSGWVYLRGLIWGGAGGMSAISNIRFDIGSFDSYDCVSGNPDYPYC